MTTTGSKLQKRPSKKFTSKYQNGKGGTEAAWAFILGYLSDNGYSPTLQEVAEAIGKATGFKVCKERARQIVQDLVKMHRVKVRKHVWRGITLVTPEEYARKNARNPGRDGSKIHPDRQVRKKRNAER